MISDLGVSSFSIINYQTFLDDALFRHRKDIANPRLGLVYEIELSPDKRGGSGSTFVNW